MTHQLDACDFVDVLEEAVTLGSEVEIDLRHGGQFRDHVRDVVTEGGQEIVVFKDHDRVPLHAIASARRARPPESTYEGKRGQ